MTEFISKYRFQVLITLIFAGLLGLFTVLSPATFLSARIYIAYMSTIPYTAIMALFMTIVIVSGEIDMSFPSIMAAGGFVFASLLHSTGACSLAVAGALGTGLVAGLVNGLIVVRIGVPSIIATIGTQFFWRGATVLASGGLALSLADFRDTAWHFIFAGRIGGVIPSQALWTLAAAVGLWVIFSCHPFGDNVRFIGDSRKASETMGLPVATTKITVFALMGVFAAFSGVLVCSEMASWWPTQGEGYMLLVFASVFIGGTSVFGGTGSIYGTFVGALIIGMIEAGIISAGISGLWTRMVYGIIVTLSVSFYALLQNKTIRIRPTRPGQTL